jgi:ankyrin repeat protein
MQKLKEILTRKPSLIHEKDNRGHTVLHAASQWAPGLRLLFDYGAKSMINAVDMAGFIPLIYAVELGSFESVELLLKNGSRLSSPGWPTTKFRANNCMPMLNRLAGEESVILAHEVVLDPVLDALIKRSRALGELAKKYLSSELQQKLVPTVGLLDSNAFIVQQALLQAGVEIPDELMVAPPNATIYHSDQIYLELAHKAFGNGFREIDSTDDNGVTPLMRHILLSHGSMVDWLLSKGAELEKPCPKSGCQKTATAMHYFANAIFMQVLNEKYGAFFTPFCTESWEPFPVLSKMAQRVLLNKSLDGCRCLCSDNGCLPRTILFKGYANENIDGHKFGRPDILRRGVEWVEIVLLDAQEQRNAVAEDLLRVLTFEKLDMKHTCCYSIFRPLPNEPIAPPIDLENEEIDEIQDEEYLLAEQLELIVNHCSAALDCFEGSIFEFLNQYWEPMVEKSLEELANSHDPDAVTKAGVVLK